MKPFWRNSNVWLAVFVVSVTVGNAYFYWKQQGDKPAPAPVPPISLPAHVNASVGSMIKLTATVEGDAKPSWHVCGDGKHTKTGDNGLPGWVFLDYEGEGKTLVAVPPAEGTYYIMAMVAKGSKPFWACCCVVVGNNPNPPPVPPGPNPPPGPLDPLTVALQQAYVLETSPHKAHQKELLMALYQVASTTTVFDQGITTVHQLYTKMVDGRRNLPLADSDLLHVRKAIETYLNSKLPTDLETKLDAHNRVVISTEYKKVAKALLETK